MVFNSLFDKFDYSLVMQKEILINWSPQETRVAVLEQGSVQEMHLERTLERGLVGNVYMGKVSRVLPGMQSAFIDVGLERAAFLHVADLQSSIAARHSEPHTTTPPTNPAELTLTPIEKQVFEGQILMVQVIKDPIGTKGARLTTQISLAGRLLVFLPQDEHIGVSQKIPLEQRNALKQRLQKLVLSVPGDPNSSSSTDQSARIWGGFILRTNGEEASDAELLEDIKYLRKAWFRMKDLSNKLPPKSIVHQDLSLLQRVLRDFVDEHTHSIKIDSREQFELLSSFANEFMPAAASKLERYSGERPIFDLFNIDDEVNKALGRRVDLKSGGYLVIDQTEALTTVDVNTGGFVGARNFDDTIFKTNLEAAGSIARQLRLRNLGGIVVVDFIDMVKEDHKVAVLSEFQKHLSKDRVKTVVSSFSSLGLVELTRKRTRESLAQLLCKPCEICSGRGIVKTARTVVYDIFREILREARQFNPAEIKVMASPEVIDLMMDEENQHLAGLSEFIGKPISLKPESSLGPETYDIVLL
jgi:ribonuclease G